MSKLLSRVLIPASATIVFITLFSAGTTPAAAQSEGQIGGIVYLDTNANGVREQGEEGLGDVEVTFDSGGWNTTVNTANNGAFSISLNPSTWTVSVDAPAGYSAPKSSVEVLLENPGDAVTNVEFALVANAETDDDETADEGGEVLPEGGAPISSSVMIGGLVGLLGVGLALVALGQYRSRSSL